MNKITKRQLIILTLGGFLSYLLFGIFDSMRGATLSSLLGDLQLNYASGGTIVMGQYAGYFAASWQTGSALNSHWYWPHLVLCLESAGIPLLPDCSL